MRDPKASNFCYYPFFQILLSADGHYKPCSKHRDIITHKGKILNTSNATLQDAWESDYMQRMRDDFLNNRMFPGCSECWRMQKMGLRSMRYDSYQYNISEQQVANPVKPVRVELNSSNICNLKCRLCSPNASTQWLPEFKKFYNSRETTHINLTRENLEQVKAWADNLEEVCFFGGEPLLFAENLELMKFLISKGRAKDVALLFNTNGTIFNDEIALILSEFKRVRISFSIDDIGKRFEYQRSNAKWEQVLENIHLAYNYWKSPLWKNVEFKICQSFSILNVYYQPEFFAFFNKYFPGLVVYWNIIYHPWEYNVQILPRPVKEILKTRLRQITTTFPLSHDETKTIDDLIIYMDHDVPQNFAEFFRYINRHDVYRGERFDEVFPEFWQVIEPYKPDDLIMGQYDPMDAWIRRNEPYHPDVDYISRLADGVETYLKKHYPDQEVATRKQQFFSRINKCMPDKNLRHLLYYILTLSRPGEIYEDINNTDDAQLSLLIKQSFAYYFADHPYPYNQNVDYAEAAGLIMKRFLVESYTETQAEILSREFVSKARQKIQAYNSIETENLLFYTLLHEDCATLYNAVIDAGDEDFFILLDETLTRYYRKLRQPYEPQQSYVQVIKDDLKFYLLKNNPDREAEQQVETLLNRIQSLIHKTDKHNQNNIYYKLSHLPIRKLYRQMITGSDEQWTAFMHQLVYHPEVDYRAMLGAVITGYLRSRENGHSVQLSERFIRRLEERLQSYRGIEAKNLLFFILMQANPEKLWKAGMQEDAHLFSTFLNEAVRNYYYHNRTVYDPHANYAEKLSAALRLLFRKSHSEAEASRLSDTFFARLQEAARDCGIEDLNKVFYFMTHTPIHQIYTEISSLSNEALRAKMQESLKMPVA
ncbi:MAG: hypothetical protein KatS3mg031_0862 [Chitinophagales bacterium]|nr:MAG: hypothetical protein KatS3mg031_0862 [Chitinophagales bacterium]